MISQRNVGFDRLRAVAILSVVAYHVVFMCPVTLPSTIFAVAWYGKYGVDLFFVLSGWLIGGLFWRELKVNGRVNLLRFWWRRWMRTLPAYLAVLVVAWLAVRIVRGQLFDPAYIVFLQNYYEQVPFFTVSWSLCVEEHFYLLMPLAGAAVVVFLNPSTRWIAWVILLSVSPLCRWYEWRPGEAWTWFGYAETATHLRLDGLVLGVGLSYMSNFSRAMFVRLSAAAVPTIAASVAGLVMLELSGDGITKYVLWPALVAAACGGFVVLAGGWQEKAGDRLWSAIAISAYSTYLTHPLALHVAARVATPPEYRFAYLPLALALIFAGSRVTYLCIERPSLWLRDRLIGPSIVGRDRFAPDPPPYRSQC